MKRVLLIAMLLSLTGCACMKACYTRRLPCPDLPLLADDATHTQLAEHDALVVQMYGECRKARRVNPKQENKP
jgi:hypothetical protein